MLKIMGRERSGSTAVRIFLSIFLMCGCIVTVLLVCLLLEPAYEENQFTSRDLINCPDADGPFERFPSSSDGNVVLENHKFLLENSVDLNTLTIRKSATLVVADNGIAIKIRTKYIHIQEQGYLVIGSETCPHLSQLEIVLYGNSTDPENIIPYGKKFIGIGPTASIDIHGPWKRAWTYLRTHLKAGDKDIIIELADSVSSWQVKDSIVIASSDYDMNHAEVFTVQECPTCTEMQVKIDGPVRFDHLAEITEEGIDLRAEVGILTRNIKIYGEMEDSCYGPNHCQFFDYDTFGGQTQALIGAKVVRLEGIELFNMGQQVLGSYPIHLHRLFASPGKYAKQLSIHDSFSRCVTLHAVQGVLVEDVVGYNVLGHCFFLEDGNEYHNTLRHNLGLVTKAGTLVTSDRNTAMCHGLTANSTNYVPMAETECNGVSTYWIAHPDNILENNAAAGSEQNGFSFPFHRVPTGPSVNTLPAFHGERSPLGSFKHNRAHSNPKAGFLIDGGVKTTEPSETDPRDFLALIDLERYAPHQNRDLSLPRAPAVIENFISFRNNIGLFARGGDIKVLGSKFSDNDIGVILASSKTIPYDAGSHQELVNSIVIGKTDNNVDWQYRRETCIGVQLQDGPVKLEQNKFFKFNPVGDRKTHAIGFLPNNTGISSPLHVFGLNSFDNKNTAFSIERTVGGVEPDGDLSRHLCDIMGSLTQNPQACLVRKDNQLLATVFCQNSSFPGALLCPPMHFGVLFLTTSTKGTVKFIDITDASATSKMINLTGFYNKRASSNMSQVYQPILLPNHKYRISWLDDKIRTNMMFQISGLYRNEYVDVELCYPSNTVFVIRKKLWNVNTDQYNSPELVEMSEDVDNLKLNTTKYHWNSATNKLTLHLVATWQTTEFNYCPEEGCHVLFLQATVDSDENFSCN